MKIVTKLTELSGAMNELASLLWNTREKGASKKQRDDMAERGEFLTQEIDELQMQVNAVFGED